MASARLKIDSFDARILDAVQRNNRLTTEQLGEIVGLSSTACLRRLARLRASGAVESDIAVISPKAVGRQFSMIVLVNLARERADIIDRFKRVIRTTPEVMSGYYIAGEADFVLVVTATDMEDYEAFTRRFFYGNPDIQSFRTLPVIDRVKASFMLPIEPSE
jgi:Lrp/AsnC family transcriptional regulator, leucine-responsive regulatory protein